MSDTRQTARVRSDGRADYGVVLRNREFVTVLVTQSLSVVGDQVARVALALLVFQRTGSALAASATYAVSYGSYVLGGPVLSALADRYPRRTVMVVSDLLRCVLIGLLGLDPPTPALFVLIALAGSVAPAFTSARSATLPDVLGDGDYATGLGLVSSAAQCSQFVGFALGGVLVAGLGSRTAFLADALTFLVSAVALGLLLEHRPATGGPRPGLLREARLGAGVVRRSPALRYWLGWGLLLSGAAAAPEGLAVAVSRAGGGGPLTAGLLTAALPLGYVLGTFAVLRVPSERRPGILPLASALSFGPLIVTPLSGSLPVTIALWVLAGAGGAAQVVANGQYALRCDPAVRGRAFGLAATALMLTQAVVLLLSGSAAGRWSPTTVVAAVGVLGLLVTLLLSRRHPDGGFSRTAPRRSRADMTGGSAT